MKAFGAICSALLQAMGATNKFAGAACVNGTLKLPVKYAGAKLEKPATKGCELIEKMCEAIDDDYLCNILEEMEAELYKTKYLLKE